MLLLLGLTLSYLRSAFVADYGTLIITISLNPGYLRMAHRLTLLQYPSQVQPILLRVCPIATLTITLVVLAC